MSFRFNFRSKFCELVLFAVALSCFPLQTSAHNFLCLKPRTPTSSERAFFQGGVESQIKHIFEETLEDKTLVEDSSAAKATIHAKKANTATTPPSLSVIDVGVNTGFFTLLAPANGATVYGFELQRTCLSRVRGHLANNPRLSRSVYLFNLGLGQEADVVEATPRTSATAPGGTRAWRKFL